MSFLHEDDPAGQALIQIVANGSVIVAEILRLSSQVPDPFLMATPAVKKKFQYIVFDMSYVELGGDVFEERIENNDMLLDLDMQFKKEYKKKLRRYYRLFEAIFQYTVDYNQYIEDLVERNYTSYTLESVLNDENGKQLLCEALHLLGVMLLLLDRNIDGVVRERLLVSHIRCEGENDLENLDQIAELISRTGYSTQATKRPSNYPEKFLRRANVDEAATIMIIDKMRSDDIYNYQPLFPNNRSAAVSKQAAMIYVCLYLAPVVLQREESVMREIVDKHFPDNFVVPYYLGFTSDLVWAWEPYNAARNALKLTISPASAASFKDARFAKVDEQLANLDFYLNEGTLSVQYLITNKTEIFKCLRECNINLKWLLLHTRRSRTQKYFTKINEGIDQKKILRLLLQIAQLEFEVRELANDIVNFREQQFNDIRQECIDRIKELTDVFSGNKPLVNVEPNTALVNWFNNTIANVLQNLEFSNSTVSGRRLQQLRQALKEVEQYHKIETNVAIKQYLKETRHKLLSMEELLNVGEDILNELDVISEFGYARQIITEYISPMQRIIKSDPRSVILLRSTFLKMAEATELTLVRLSFVNSDDTITVSEYYSKTLINFVRKVLNVIPETMFEKLSDIIQIQTTELEDLPNNVEKDMIKDFAKLEIRGRLSKLCYEISVFTAGILAMETTLVGVIQVEPKQLLEDGIRAQLVKKISEILDQKLRFKKDVRYLENAFLEVGGILAGFQKSFTYIQDYMSIYGLKMWQEEFQRIMRFNVEQECNQFLKSVSGESEFQTVIAPIPEFEAIDTSVNFIGRLGREIIHHTHYYRTVYIDKMFGWHSRNGDTLVSIRNFSLLMNSVGVYGVRGLDELFSFMIVDDLQIVLKRLDSELKANNERVAGLIKQSSQDLNSENFGSEELRRSFAIQKALTKMWNWLVPMIASIGQKQLLRKHLSNILSLSSRLDSQILYVALENLNNSIITDLEICYTKEDTPFPSPDNPIFSMLGKYLEYAGLNEPLTQIYITADPIEYFSALLFLMVLSHASKFHYSAHRGINPRSTSDAIDSTSFIVGLVTFTQQFDEKNIIMLLKMISTYLKSSLSATLDQNQATYPVESRSLFIFLEVFQKYHPLSEQIWEEIIPPYLSAHFER